MKGAAKYLLIQFLALFIFLPGLAEEASPVNLRINEIMYNCPSSQTEPKCEWVEIYNNGDENINLPGFIISDFTGGSNPKETFHFINFFQGSFELQPGSYAVISNNPDEFIKNYPDDSLTLNIYKAAIILNNNPGDTITLYDKEDKMVDRVTYSNTWGGAEKSLERQDPNLPNDENNWHDSWEQGGTPGRINNRAPDIPTNLNHQDSILSWSESIDPDGHPINYLLEIYQDGSIYQEISDIVDPSYEASLESGDYSFRVAASDGILQSDFSDNFNFSIIGTVYGNSVRVNELLPDPASPLKDSDDEAIELYNFGDLPANLLDWKLQDDSGKVYPLGEIILNPGKFLVLKSSDTGISLNNDGDRVLLFSNLGTLISETPNYGKAKEGKSFSRKDDGSWDWTNPSLGSKNIFDSISTVLGTSSKKSSKGPGSISYPTGGADFSEYIFTPVVLGEDQRGKTIVSSLKASPVTKSVSDQKTSATPYILWYIMLFSTAGILFILFYPWKREMAFDAQNPELL